MVRRLKPSFPDLGDLPAVTEGVTDLLLGDPPRSLTGRFLIAEAEDVDRTSGTDNRRQPRDVQRSLLVGEGVKQPAVDHRIEGATQLIKLQGVTDLKIDAQPPLLRLRSLDGDGDEVETPDLMPTGCQVEGVLSGAAPGVEDRALGLSPPPPVQRRQAAGRGCPTVPSPDMPTRNAHCSSL